jgi:hypothetical protein
VFTDPRGVQRIGLTYNANLRCCPRLRNSAGLCTNAGVERYVLVTAHDDGSGATHTPALGVFDAPEPWGPWTTVYYDDRWSTDGWMIHHKFPTAWMSADGRTMWLAFSGKYVPGGQDYCLLARKATLTVVGG